MTGSGFEPRLVERIGTTGLTVHWGDGHESLYAWTYLRALCPCAACRENPPTGKEMEAEAAQVKPVGRYAMTILWGDGHATGIFSYEYLRSLCRCEACRPKQFTEG